MDKEKKGCACSEMPENGVSRRSVLILATTAIGALITGILGGAGLSYFSSPAFKKDEEDWVDIGKISSLKPGAPLKVDFVARKRDAWQVTEKRASAWVLTSDGRNFTVFDPRCTHLGCPFRWDSDKKQFLCPCHAGVFDADGKVVSGPPPRPLDQYKVKVANGRLLVQPTPQRGIA